MKAIGLIGGMSWESTIPYYSIINQGINQKLGKNHSARCSIYSFDFQEIEELQYSNDWETLHDKIIAAGKSLKLTGADFVVLCTNTMHKVVDDFEKETGIPLLHIADAIGEKITQKGMTRIGLLGTIFTMEQDFYKDRLQKKFGLSILTPDAEDRKTINEIIYQELVKGVIKESSEKKYVRIMDKMQAENIEGIILGCTEIGLLVKDYSLPLFDSAKIHAEKAVEVSLQQEIFAGESLSR